MQYLDVGPLKAPGWLQRRRWQVRCLSSPFHSLFSPVFSYDRLGVRSSALIICLMSSVHVPVKVIPFDGTEPQSSLQSSLSHVPFVQLSPLVV